MLAPKLSIIISYLGEFRMGDVSVALSVTILTLFEQLLNWHIYPFFLFFFYLNLLPPKVSSKTRLPFLNGPIIFPIGFLFFFMVVYLVESRYINFFISFFGFRK